MPDNTNNRGEPDRSLINVHESYELRYWCSRFGVTEEQLKQAVKAVGPSVDKVRKYLGK